MRLIIVLTALMGVSFSGMAYQSDSTLKEQKQIELKLVDDNKIQLIHKANPEGLLHVKIYDDEEVLMVRDRIATTKPFTKKYDFSKLEPGKYTLALYDSKGELDQLVIDLTPAEKERPVYSRVKKISPTEYKVLVNASVASDMIVSIYDKGKLIYEDREANTKGFQKIYKLQSHLKWTDVEFRISTENGFSKLISSVD